MMGDTLALATETLEGEPIMEHVMVKGKLIMELPEIHAIQKRAKKELDKLPGHLRDFSGNGYYPVYFSDALVEYQKLAKR
jgi:hypothetical protein